MNVVFLSPHFPPNYFPFCAHLRSLGANVLGIADAPYEALRPELRGALTEYYRVDDLEDYDQLLRALGYFTHRYGKLDRLDSHNEYWLETEANLRTDFNIPGLKAKDILNVKRKSLMKKVYQKAGVNVARGQVVRTLKDAQALIAETGYPVVAKPDIGVGAARTYKILNDLQLEMFFAEKPPVDYFMEEFITGQIVSFDGLVGRDGELLFSTAHVYSTGVMEAVNDGSNIYYYSYRQIPDDLLDVGLRTLKAFKVRERFFHFEFFRTPDDRLVALEVNMRPPGGFTTDMFNFANNIDIYKGWAELIVTGTTSLESTRPYHVCYAGRKHSRIYEHSHEAILETIGEGICAYEPVEGVFSAALGNYGYIFRSPDPQKVIEWAEFIQQVA